MAAMVRHGEVTDVRRMLDEMAERDMVSWNTIMDVYPCEQNPLMDTSVDVLTEVVIYLTIMR
jgi:pentatricopeptide repeat protein